MSVEMLDATPPRPRRVAERATPSAKRRPSVVDGLVAIGVALALAELTTVRVAIAVGLGSAWLGCWIVAARDSTDSTADRRARARAAHRAGELRASALLVIGAIVAYVGLPVVLDWIASTDSGPPATSGFDSRQPVAWGGD